jgi:H+/Cl- antiporter ClcA
MDWVNTLPIIIVIGICISILGHMVYQSWMTYREQRRMNRKGLK